jgi:hypothetical protein
MVGWGEGGMGTDHVHNMYIYKYSSTELGMDCVKIIFTMFFGGLECAGHSFAYVVNF